MNERRLELHEIFCQILGTNNVYFQPPESIKLKYPAIVYERDNIDNLHADDGVYLSRRRYSVIVIDKNPDSLLLGKVAALPTCSFSRHFNKDNLNHDAFTLYY